MKNFSKHSGHFIGIALLILGLNSCKSDDGETATDYFLGEYKGEISYTDGQNPITNQNGSVVVVKDGEDYKLEFSDGIPIIEGIDYVDYGEVLSNVDADENQLIRITETTLQVIYTSDDNQHEWKAVCYKE